MQVTRRMLVAAVLVVAAACSSDGAAGSKADFIAEGDAICTSFMEETDTFGDPETPEQLVELLDAAVALGEQTLEDLNDLNPPSDGEAVKTALIDSLETSFAKVVEARDATVAGDLETAGNALDEASDLGRASDEEAKAYGFKVCGSEDEL